MGNGLPAKFQVLTRALTVAEILSNGLDGFEAQDHPGRMLNKDRANAVQALR